MLLYEKYVTLCSYYEKTDVAMFEQVAFKFYPEMNDSLRSNRKGFIRNFYAKLYTGNIALFTAVWGYFRLEKSADKLTDILTFPRNYL